MAATDQAAVIEALRGVMDPELHKDIVTLGMAKNIQVNDGKVSLLVTLTTPACPLRETIERDVRAALAKVPGVSSVDLKFDASVPEARRLEDKAPIPGVKNLVAVASGKGGVGKTTVAVNLAIALKNMGALVGLLDADVYGPSVPLMLGLRERPQSTDDRRIIPLQRFGVKVISLGLFIEDHTPVIWRGPMITKLLTQFLRDVEWGNLDYLVLDLPPGTGDAQLTITQQVALTGGVIVTTPQDVALLDVKRSIVMFQQVNAPVLGVVENMSYHICSGCGDRAEPFGHGGGEKVARQFGIPFLGEIPLVREIREAGDTGKPIVAADPKHPQSQAFRSIAERILAEIAARPESALPMIH